MDKGTELGYCVQRDTSAVKPPWLKPLVTPLLASTVDLASVIENTSPWAPTVSHIQAENKTSSYATEHQ